MNIDTIEISAGAVRSLAWRGDTLVDWVAGGVVYHLDRRPTYSLSGPVYEGFDACVTTPRGRHVVLYERCGTRGLLLRDGRVLRELQRSPRNAESFEYPVCLWTASDGTTRLAHCPREYNHLEIEDADT